ncbi:winged helix-turn-helix domain-containing protein [Eubacteriales bacterium OttesenSCG-928-N13]|nr:winged helix-turn-helix domain-containing protein [Eubacteriales bacterium OttesenSCG-928-N13]
MEHRIQVKMFGRFEILVDGKPTDALLSKTRKGQALLQYLLLHRNEAVPNYKLYEALWPNEESSNPENALKTLVSRLRAVLVSCSEELGKCIITKRGSYRWNNDLGIEVDLFEYERLCKELKGVTVLGPDELKGFNQVLEMYTGNLLSGIEHEEWIISRSIYLHNEYLRLVYQFIDLLKEAQDFDEVIRVCRVALDVDAFDERLHLELMDALVKTKRNNEALLQYKHVTNIHFRYLGIQPPEGIREFYKQIIRAGQALDMDIDSISKELKEYDMTGTAFICEYAVFKEIYNLQIRNIERTGAIVFLALIMITSMDYQPMDPLKLDDIMRDLLEVLKQSLRKGDIVTHFSASQYAMLLPCAQYDNGKMVMERIKRAFYKISTNSSVMFSYRIDMIKELDKMGNQTNG